MSIDTRYKQIEKFELTTVIRSPELLAKELKNLSNNGKYALVVMRGLPASGSSEVASQLGDTVDVYSLTDYLPKNKNGDCIYENIKNASINMRKDVVRALSKKHSRHIVVDAPHIYLWELKYYRVQSYQLGGIPFYVYEHRVVLPAKVEERVALLKEAKVTELIQDATKWLVEQKAKTKMLPNQLQLIEYLTTPDAVTKLSTIPSKTKSFLPTVLLNIQLAAYLTSKSANSVFLDLVWNYMEEWQEIVSDRHLWSFPTPKWGY
jgi:hypothetical protein